MATETKYLKGKANYARLVEPDIKYNKWSLLLYPDAPSLEIIKELMQDGLKNKLKIDDDGHNMTFSRPTFRDNRKTGMREPFAPPVVVNADGTPHQSTEMIGNGTDVTIGLEVYEHSQPGTSKKAKAARLKSVRIENLVPYEQYAKEDDPLAIKAIPKMVF